MATDGNDGHQVPSALLQALSPALLSSLAPNRARAHLIRALRTHLPDPASLGPSSPLVQHLDALLLVPDRSSLPPGEENALHPDDYVTLLRASSSPEWALHALSHPSLAASRAIRKAAAVLFSKLWHSDKPIGGKAANGGVPYRILLGRVGGPLGLLRLMDSLSWETLDALVRGLGEEYHGLSITPLTQSSSHDPRTAALEEVLSHLLRPAPGGSTQEGAQHDKFTTLPPPLSDRADLSLLQRLFPALSPPFLERLLSNRHVRQHLSPRTWACIARNHPWFAADLVLRQFVDPGSDRARGDGQRLSKSGAAGLTSLRVETVNTLITSLLDLDVLSNAARVGGSTLDAFLPVWARCGDHDTDSTKETTPAGLSFPRRFAIALINAYVSFVVRRTEADRHQLQALAQGSVTDDDEDVFEDERDRRPLDDPLGLSTPVARVCHLFRLADEVFFTGVKRGSKEKRRRRGRRALEQIPEWSTSAPSLDASSHTLSDLETTIRLVSFVSASVASLDEASSSTTEHGWSWYFVHRALLTAVTVWAKAKVALKSMERASKSSQVAPQPSSASAQSLHQRFEALAADARAILRWFASNIAADELDLSTDDQRGSTHTQVDDIWECSEERFPLLGVCWTVPREWRWELIRLLLDADGAEARRREGKDREPGVLVSSVDLSTSDEVRSEASSALGVGSDARLAQGREMLSGLPLSLGRTRGLHPLLLTMLLSSQAHALLSALIASPSIVSGHGLCPVSWPEVGFASKVLPKTGGMSYAGCFAYDDCKAWESEGGLSKAEVRQRVGRVNEAIVRAWWEGAPRIGQGQTQNQSQSSTVAAIANYKRDATRSKTASLRQLNVHVVLLLAANVAAGNPQLFLNTLRWCLERIRKDVQARRTVYGSVARYHVIPSLSLALSDALVGGRKSLYTMQRNGKADLAELEEELRSSHEAIKIFVAETRLACIEPDYGDDEYERVGTMLFKVVHKRVALLVQLTRYNAAAEDVERMAALLLDPLVHCIEDYLAIQVDGVFIDYTQSSSSNKLMPPPLDTGLDRVVVPSRLACVVGRFLEECGHARERVLQRSDRYVDRLSNRIFHDPRLRVGVAKRPRRRGKLRANRGQPSLREISPVLFERLEAAVLPPKDALQSYLFGKRKQWEDSAESDLNRWLEDVRSPRERRAKVKRLWEHYGPSVVSDDKLDYRLWLLDSLSCADTSDLISDIRILGEDLLPSVLPSPSEVRESFDRSGSIDLLSCCPPKPYGWPSRKDDRDAVLLKRLAITVRAGFASRDLVELFLGFALQCHRAKTPSASNWDWSKAAKGLAEQGRQLSFASRVCVTGNFGVSLNILTRPTVLALIRTAGRRNVLPAREFSLVVQTLSSYCEPGETASDSAVMAARGAHHIPLLSALALQDDASWAISFVTELLKSPALSSFHRNVFHPGLFKRLPIPVGRDTLQLWIDNCVALWSLQADAWKAAKTDEEREKLDPVVKVSTLKAFVQILPCLGPVVTLDEVVRLTVRLYEEVPHVSVRVATIESLQRIITSHPAEFLPEIVWTSLESFVGLSGVCNGGFEPSESTWLKAERGEVGMPTLDLQNQIADALLQMHPEGLSLGVGRRYVIRVLEPVVKLQTQSHSRWLKTFLVRHGASEEEREFSFPCPDGLVETVRKIFQNWTRFLPERSVLLATLERRVLEPFEAVKVEPFLSSLDREEEGWRTTSEGETFLSTYHYNSDLSTSEGTETTATISTAFRQGRFAHPVAFQLPDTAASDSNDAALPSWMRHAPLTVRALQDSIRRLGLRALGPEYLFFASDAPYKLRYLFFFDQILDHGLLQTSRTGTKWAGAAAGNLGSKVWIERVVPLLKDFEGALTRSMRATAKDQVDVANGRLLYLDALLRIKVFLLPWPVHLPGGAIRDSDSRHGPIAKKLGSLVDSMVRLPAPVQPFLLAVLPDKLGRARFYTDDLVPILRRLCSPERYDPDEALDEALGFAAPSPKDADADAYGVREAARVLRHQIAAELYRRFETQWEVRIAAREVGMVRDWKRDGNMLVRMFASTLWEEGP